MKILSFILIALLGFSCINNQSSNQSKNYSSKSYQNVLQNNKVLIDQSTAKDTNSNYLNTLQKRKAFIDRDTSKQIVEFDKMYDKTELVRVLNRNSSDEEGLDYSYFVLMDKGKVIRVTYSPLIENGDGVLQYRHYFDADGHTFAFEKEVGGFVLPNNGFAFETTIDYFDPQFKSIKHIYKLVDTNKKAIDTNRVAVYRLPALDFNNKIYPTAAECLSAYHIKL